jgi:transcriptional regulator with XRE-family HTH domain
MIGIACPPLIRVLLLSQQGRHRLVCVQKEHDNITCVLTEGQGDVIMNISILGERIKKLRLSKGLTLEDVGEFTGLTRHSLGNIENSRRLPSLETIMAIANFFQVSLDYLTGRTDIAEINPTCYVRLDADLKHELETLAAEEMRTVENQIEYFLRKGLQSHKS